MTWLRVGHGFGCGDEVACALARARVSIASNCTDSINAPHHDGCVIGGGLTLQGVGAPLVEAPMLADGVTLPTRATIVVKCAWW